MSDLNQLSIKDLIKLIHQRELTVSDLLEAYICRIDLVNPKINALVQSNFSAAREAAFAADQKLQRANFTPHPLFGIPFTAKDLYSVPNYVVTFGTQGLTNKVCQHKNTVIARLLDQGCIFLGLTNTPEMGVSLETDNLVYGRTNHPLNQAYSSGGSSGGEAALIASHASPMGIAGDHGGGARYPSHCCGVFTLRPSLGRLPQTGCVVPKRGWVALTSRIAPMTNHIDDLEILFHTIHGGDGFDPYAERPLPQPKQIADKNIRVASLVDPQFTDIDPAIPGIIEQLCHQMPQQGIHVDIIETSLFKEGISIAQRLFQADAGRGLRTLLSEIGTTALSQQTQTWLDQQPQDPLSMEQYASLWAEWDEYKIKFLTLFQNHDILICPASPQCALPHGQTLKHNAIWPLIRYTASLTLTECPVVVIPYGCNQQQLPIGIQVIAKPWSDELALAAARKISQLRCM